MNNQEAFDKVWQWFVVERHRAGMIVETRADGIRDCRYFIDPQTKCAIGCLVSDEIAAKLGVMGIGEIQDKYLQESNLGFLIELRMIHDSSTNPMHNNFHNALESQLGDLADRYELQIPVEAADSIAIENLIEETKLETATA